MASRKLTDRFARTAPGPSGDSSRAYLMYYDSVVRGFALRVTRNASKSWVLNFRVNRIERRLTIGDYDSWPIAMARDEARRLKRMIDTGQDPMLARHQARAAPTISDLCERYCEEHLPKKRPGSQGDDRAMIAQWIIPEIGSRRVAEIRHGDIERLHRKVTAHGTPIRANRLASLLSKMFALAIKWEMRADNPVRGLERNAEVKRERFLSADETRRLVAALEAFQDRAAANALMLFLLTGCRKDELLSARWDQFDLTQGTWTKPASTTKQRRLHHVPLGAAALAILKAMANDAKSAYLFPAKRHAKNPLHLVDLKNEWAKIRKTVGIEDVRMHDLRHCFASILVSGGASLPLIGRLLGHSRVETTQRYSHLMIDPLRVAADSVGTAVTGRLPSEC